MKSKPPFKECLICGTTFYKTQTKSWKEWNETAKYCSRRCSALSVRDQTISRNKAGKGKVFTKDHINKLKKARVGRKPSLGMRHTQESKELIRRRVIETQTPEVRLKKSLSHRGEKNYNWKGGRMSLKHRMRTNTKYIEWRTAVFTGDNFTCTHCNDSRGGNLEADHIITVENIFDAFKIKTIDEAIDCELLWEISNGRTLCKDCHIKRHNRVL